MDVYEQQSTFQGLTLQAPDTVFLTETTQGRFIWERDDLPRETTYEGSLYLEGRFSVFVPQGKQEEIWANFPDKINFVVKDLTKGEVQERRRIAGGWRIARMGISVQMAKPEEPEIDYSLMAENAVDSRHYKIELFDDLAHMPAPPTVLEIYTEYRGFKSPPVRVNVLLATEE